MAFSSDDKYLATIAFTNQTNTLSRLIVWNLSDGKQIKDLALESAILLKNSNDPYIVPPDALGFVPDTSVLAYANANTLQLLDLSGSDEPVTIDLGENMFASKISFPHDGRFLYVLMAWDKDHGYSIDWRRKDILQIWHAKLHYLSFTIDFPETDYFDREFMYLHNSFLIRNNNSKGTLELENLETGEVSPLPYHDSLIYVSDDNKFMLFIPYYLGLNNEQYGGIEFWNIDRWKLVYTLKPDCYSHTEGNASPGYQYGEIAISPDNQWLALGYNGQIFIYDIRLLTVQ